MKIFIQKGSPLLCGIGLLSLLFLSGIVDRAEAVRPQSVVEDGTFIHLDVRGPLLEPSSIWFDRYRNRILVTSTGSHRVMVYSAEGALERVLGEKGGVKFPYGIASDRDGTLYVSEKESGQIKKFLNYGEGVEEKDGSSFKVFQPRGMETDKPMMAGRLMIGRDDRIYVIDRANFRVVVLNPDGEVVKTFGKRGLGKGQFIQPSDLCMDVTGRIYVTDKGAHRVLVFAREGKFLYRLGRDLRRMEGFEESEGITEDRFGNLWMTDPVKQRLIVKDVNGNPVLTFPETAGGVISLFFPVDLVFDTTDRLYVLEKGSNAIRVFGVRY